MDADTDYENDDSREPSSHAGIAERDHLDFYTVTLANSNDSNNSDVLRIKEATKSIEEPVESAAKVEEGPTAGGERLVKGRLKRKKCKGVKTKFRAESKLKGRIKMKAQSLPGGAASKASRSKGRRRVGDEDPRVVQQRKKLTNVVGGDALTNPGPKKTKRTTCRDNNDNPETGKKGKPKKRTRYTPCGVYDDAGEVKRTLTGRMKFEKRKAARPTSPSRCGVFRIGCGPDGGRRSRERATERA